MESVRTHLSLRLLQQCRNLGTLRRQLGCALEVAHRVFVAAEGEAGLAETLMRFWICAVLEKRLLAEVHHALMIPSLQVRLEASQVQTPSGTRRASS